jgi:glycosyltransferase involved in cell wall biosynthesis
MPSVSSGYHQEELRVIFLTHSFVRHRSDFAGAFLLELARGLAGIGIQVAAVAPHDSGVALREMIGGVEIFRFRYGPEPWERLAYRGNMHDLVRRPGINQALFLAFMATFLQMTLRSAARWRPHLLHAHWWIPGGMVGLVASRLLGLPLVLTVHGTDIVMIEKMGWVRPMARCVLGGAHRLTVASSFLLDKLEQVVPGCRDHTRLLSMPVDMECFRPLKTQRQERTWPLVVSVARLTEQKGLSHLLQSLDLLRAHGRPFELHILGEGPYRLQLEQEVRGLRLEKLVRLWGAVPRDEVPSHLREADVVVLPSVGEGFGVALVEAMACGKPVVGTRSGGIIDIVRDGETGYLVPPADPQALANALDLLLTDRTLAQRMGAEGRRRAVEEYSTGIVAERLRGIYQEVLG